MTHRHPNTQTQPTAPRLLSVKEAAAFMQVCERTLWGWTDRGELPAVRFGRVKRYVLADLEAFIARQKTGTTPGLTQ
jgi:excisionase family DNA binding protein